MKLHHRPMLRYACLLTGLLMAAGPLRAATSPDGAIVASAQDIHVAFSADSELAPAVLDGKGTVSLEKPPVKTALGSDAVRAVIAAEKAGLHLWFKANVELRDDIRRVGVWVNSRGMSWSEARMVLEDPQGRVCTYKMQTIGDSPWTSYEIDWLRKGAAISTLETRKATGRWRFCGLALRYAPFATGAIQLGELVTSAQAMSDKPLASWSLRDVDHTLIKQLSYTGFRIACEKTDWPATVPLSLLMQPARQADSITWQIADARGRIVRTGSMALSNFDVAAHDFQPPALAEGTYWLRVKFYDARRNLLAHNLLAYTIHRSPVTVDSAKSDGESAGGATGMFDCFWPGAGRVELLAEASAASPIAVPLSGAEAGDVVRFSWLDAGSTVVAQSAHTLSAAQSLSIPLPNPLAGPQRYTLRLTLERGGIMIDTRDATLDVQTRDQPFTGGNSPAAAAHFQLRETDTRSLLATEIPAGEAFIQHAAKNGSQMFMAFNWDEVEPREGFLQFLPMDDRFGRAAKTNLGVIPTLFIHQDRLPQWMWYPQMLDQGLQNRHYSASFLRRTTIASEEMRARLGATIRQIVRHYKQSPNVVGWNFSQGIESVWSDAARNGYVVDYSTSANRGFAAYLKETGWTLARVAKESGRPVATWSDVTPPQPEFNARLDLRPLWLAFEDYKQITPSRYFESVFLAVRSEDSQRPIYHYGAMGVGDLTPQLAVFRKHHATLCFGGGDSTVSPFFESLCQQGQVHFDAEASAVPPYQPQLLLTLFNKLSHGSTEGGSNIMWGRFFNSESADHVAGAKIAATWANMINGIGASEPALSDVAVGVGTRSLVNSTRSFMWIDWMNIPRNFGFADMIVHTIGRCAQVGYVTDHTPADQLRKWKAVIFQESPILEDASAARLDEYVRAGGTLILQGQTGRYNERGEETWALRKRLNVSADDQTHQVGAGKVRWLAKPLNWGQRKSVLDELAGDTGYRRPVQVEPATIRHALRRSANDGSYTLILFGKTWEGGNPRKEQVGQTPISGTVKMPVLAMGQSLELKDMSTGENLGTHSAEMLSKGISVEVVPATMRIIRMTPRDAGGK